MGRDRKKSVPDAWRTYLELAMGVTEASRKKASKVAKDLMGRTNVTAEQVQTFTEDLLSASLANRESMAKLVRFELDRALGLVGLATAEEVADLTKRVRELELELRDAKAASGELAPALTGDRRNGHDQSAGPAAPAKKAAKKAANKAVKKAVAAKKTVPAKKAVPATKAAAAKKVVAKATTKKVAGKATTKKVAAKATTKTAATKKTATTKAAPAKAATKTAKRMVKNA